jgi:hypothetical protein
MRGTYYVKSLLPKLGKACFAIRNMKLCSNIETLRMIYHAHFHSIMKYGIILWSNSPGAKKIFLLQKRILRIMMGMKQRDFENHNLILISNEIDSCIVA